MIALSRGAGPRCLILLAASGCADLGLSTEAGGLVDTDAGSWSNDTAGGGGLGPTLPEDEEDRLRLAPATTSDWVFLVDPERSLLTRVATDGTSVLSVEVGEGPAAVRTTSDGTTAVVLSPGDATMALVDADLMTMTMVAVRDDLDRLDLSPDGRWAMAWFDAFAPDALEGGDGLQSYSEASFVEVVSGKHVPLVVGYRPRQVAFTPDGTTAVVVTDDTLAVVDLTAPDLAARLVAFDPDALEPPAAEEIALDPSGEWAWVRRAGGDELLVVEIATGAVSFVPACVGPTDLDITPDGATAIVVCRGSSEMVFFDARDPAQPPRSIDLDPDLSIGQIDLSADGSFGVLFSTAFLVERFTIWSAADDSLVTRGLVKPIDSLDITPDGESLIVFHTLSSGADSDAEFGAIEALTLVDLDSLLAAPIALPAPAASHAMGFRHSAVVLEGTPLLLDVDHATLLTSTVALHSDPIFTGLLPDLDPTDGDNPRMWVNQDHDLGRISFWDPDDLSLETLTGFALNGGIEDGP